VTSIAGDPPNLLNPPPGCRFEPRCDVREPVCVQREIALVETEPGHLVRCVKVGG
jgi:oligopeptide/dipeptide ABC transporter ATP-binding protein